MTEYKDVLGNPVNIGDRIAVAFSYTRANVGYLRIGTVESLEPDFKMKWESGQVSPKMVYAETRIVGI